MRGRSLLGILGLHSVMIGVGDQLGGYTILGRIGRGAMGEVLLARHLASGLHAAIKVLIPELAQRTAVLDQFFEEARAASSSGHPGMVELFDCGRDRGHAFVAMEVLAGETLATYLRRVGALYSDLSFLLGVVASVTDTVATAHARGIIHRDLRPENIFLHRASATDQAVVVKVCDFGITRLSGTDGVSAQPEGGVLLSAPTYLAPEQCRGVGPPDARSDIYSLGGVLYHCLCGRPPFPARGVGELIVAHISQAPTPPHQLIPRLDPMLNQLTLRLLAKDPALRPQFMTEVTTALREIARSAGIDLGVGPRPVEPVQRPADAPPVSQLDPRWAVGSMAAPRAVAPPPVHEVNRPRQPSAFPVTLPMPWPAPMPMEPTIRPLVGGTVLMEEGHAAVSSPLAGGTKIMTSEVPPFERRHGWAGASGATQDQAEAMGRRNRWLAVVGAGILLVAGVTAIVLATGGRKSPGNSAPAPTTMP